MLQEKNFKQIDLMPSRQDLESSADAIVESIYSAGYKDGALLSGVPMVGNVPLFTGANAAKATRGLIEQGNVAQFSQHSSNVQAQFSTSGQIAVADQTGMMDGVIMQIASSLDSNWSLSTQFPDRLLPAVDQIWVEWVEGVKGLANDYVYGSAVPQVRQLANGTYSYQAPAVREQKIYNEQDILFYRQLGGNISDRGIMQKLAYNSLDSMVRMQNKKKVTLANYVFNGSYTFAPANGMAPLTIASGVPASNTLTPIVAPWGVAGSGVNAGTYVPNNSANPVLDMQFWFSSASNLKRLLPYIKGLIMNPNTVFLFMQNNNTQAYINRVLANNSVISAGRTYGMELVADIAIPAVKKFDIIVDYTGWSALSASGVDPQLPTAFNYFVPDGQILFEMDIPATFGGPLGDFVFLGQVQNGGFVNPQPGPFLIIEDLTMPGSRGGLINPQLAQVSGYAGGPRIRRVNDVITANVIATPNT